MNLNAGQDPSLHWSQESPCFDSSTQWMGLWSPGGGVLFSGAVALACLPCTKTLPINPLPQKHGWWLVACTHEPHTPMNHTLSHKQGTLGCLPLNTSFHPNFWATSSLKCWLLHILVHAAALLHMQWPKDNHQTYYVYLYIYIHIYMSTYIYIYI